MEVIYNINTKIHFWLGENISAFPPRSSEGSSGSSQYTKYKANVDKRQHNFEVGKIATGNVELQHNKLSTFQINIDYISFG